MGFDVQSTYFSGQGVMMIGTRDATGKPVSLRPVGNVSDLKISVATSVVEHHESQTGVRGIDLRLQTEIKATLAATMQSFNQKVLESTLRSTSTGKPGLTVTDEAIKFYGASVIPTANINHTSVTNVKRGAQALTAYLNDTTAWDYRPNLPAGSILFNDGALVAVDKLTTGGTAPTVAPTTAFPSVVIVANTAVVGDSVVFTGFAGADAGLVNGKTFKILARTAAQVSIDFDGTGKTITLGTPLSIFDGQALTVSYVSGAWKLSDALAGNPTDYWVRFEGLNTADSNNPVIVDIFKMQADPLKELALISDDVGSFVLEGNVISDSLQASGSKYFKISQLRA